MAATRERGWRLAWLAWLFAFLVVEIPAAIKKTGGTLSENTWDWFSVRERKRFWLARRFVLGLFMAELSAHFLTGGAYPVTGGLAVIVAGTPAAVVIVLSSILEREEGNVMLKWLALKFVKARWGELLPALFKAAAEGKFGEKVKFVYWRLAGYKTFIGFVVTAASGCLWLATQFGICPECAGWGTTVAEVGVFLGTVGLSIGLVDGATRAPWPTGTLRDPQALK